MKCPQCQHENTQEARFCNSCGARLEVTCPSCAYSNAPGSRFCNQCGHSLEVAAAPVAETTFASPQAYTPKHLAEKILTSKSALEGERKQVTVLFCDIVDSSRLAERLDPEAMHEVMDRVGGSIPSLPTSCFFSSLTTSSSPRRFTPSATRADEVIQ